MSYIEIPIPRLTPADTFHCVAVSPSYIHPGRVKLYFEVWRFPTPEEQATFVGYIITEVQLAYAPVNPVQIF